MIARLVHSDNDVYESVRLYVIIINDACGSYIIALVSKIKDLMREYNRKLHELQSERSCSRRLEQRNQVLQRDSEILQTIRDEIGNDGVEEILDRAQQRAEEEAELYEQERASRSNEWDLSL